MVGHAHASQGFIRTLIMDMRSATNDSEISCLAQGHELGLHVLYQLFADHACSDVDQPTSTSAAYDQFLLSLVCLCNPFLFQEYDVFSYITATVQRLG